MLVDFGMFLSFSARGGLLVRLCEELFDATEELLVDDGILDGPADDDLADIVLFTAGLLCSSSSSSEN